MPYGEPNAIPEIFDSAAEWRETYAKYVQTYADSQRTRSDATMLEINLKKLGYTGKLLQDEMTYITTK